MQTYGEGTGSKGRKLWSPWFQNLGKEQAFGNAALECIVPVMPARSGALGSMSPSALVTWGAEKVALKSSFEVWGPKAPPQRSLLLHYPESSRKGPYSQQGPSHPCGDVQNELMSCKPH